ncbi:hypothetical protein, partial [Caballeronia zhejiangensis]|uniref:hypothetical protein n=1 Tax=Caballeronia zhejiangensis TaxID=871203 RepID=UPI001EF45182
PPAPPPWAYAPTDSAIASAEAKTFAVMLFIVASDNDILRAPPARTDSDGLAYVMPSSQACHVDRL